MGKLANKNKVKNNFSLVYFGSILPYLMPINLQWARVAHKLKIIKINMFMFIISNKVLNACGVWKEIKLEFPAIAIKLNSIF